MSLTTTASNENSHRVELVNVSNCVSFFMLINRMYTVKCYLSNLRSSFVTKVAKNFT
jgi:hypothetical protein